MDRSHTARRRTIRYDAARRRLWILGQRCHHGAAGVLIAGFAGAWLAASTAVPRPDHEAGAAARAIVVAGLGGILMLHDRKDHAFWFRVGADPQL
jgi:hypothetical protein